MDVESKETLDAAIEHVRSALVDTVNNAVVKLEVVLHDVLADTVAAVNGWELVISPITIKLVRNLK